MSIDPDHLNYVVKVAYNGTNAAGGDSLTEDLNIFYEVSFNLNRPANLARWPQKVVPS